MIEHTCIHVVTTCAFLFAAAASVNAAFANDDYKMHLSFDHCHHHHHHHCRMMVIVIIISCTPAAT